MISLPSSVFYYAVEYNRKVEEYLFIVVIAVFPERVFEFCGLKKTSSIFDSISSSAFAAHLSIISVWSVVLQFEKQKEGTDTANNNFDKAFMPVLEMFRMVLSTLSLIDNLCTWIVGGVKSDFRFCHTYLEILHGDSDAFRLSLHVNGRIIGFGNSEVNTFRVVLVFV